MLVRIRRPRLTTRSSALKIAGRPSIHSPNRLGKAPHSSSARGWKYSVVATSVSSAAATSTRTRARRDFADLEVGDARDVVVGHRGGDIFGGCGGEGEAPRLPALRAIDVEQHADAIEIFERIIGIEIVDQTPHSGEQHRLH